MSAANISLIDDRIADSRGHHVFVLQQRIGAGNFGEIYFGYDAKLAKNDPRNKFAIKVERIKQATPQLVFEYERYKLLRGLAGFPQVVQFNKLLKHPEYHGLVLELLGDSLLKLVEARPADKDGKKCFSEPTVIQIALQCIARIKALHDLGILYRDVKPENFLIGRKELGEQGVIFLVDMGLTKMWKTEDKRGHIPYEQTGLVLGTQRYMAQRPHEGWTHTRRDDLEALGNMFAWFRKSRLPWQGLPKEEAAKKIPLIKAEAAAAPESKLFGGMDPAFGVYYRAVRALRYDQEPDYTMYLNLFERALYASYPKFINKMDWVTP